MHRAPELELRRFLPSRRAYPLALALLALCVYANALFNGFAWDDASQLLKNPLVRDVGRLPEIFTTGVWTFAGAKAQNYYRPIQFALYMALYQVVGFHPFPFHALLLLMHAGNTLLVYGLGRRLTGSTRAALAAAALFAVHPIHTEAVVWVAALPDVLLTLLLLAAVRLFVAQGASPRGLQVAGHCALYLLALLTKEPGAMLLPLFVGYEWLYLGRPLRQLWRNVALYSGLLLIFVFYLLLRYAALGGLAPGQGVHIRLTPSEYALSVVVTAGKYLLKLVLPTGLNYFHVFHPTRAVTPAFLVSLLALSASLAAVPLLRRRGSQPASLAGTDPLPVVSYGLFWVLVTLAPALNLTGVGENVFAERYLYLPSVGFVWAVGLGWDWLAARRWRAALCGGVLILAVSAIAVILRNRDWRDDFTLFTASARQRPDVAVFHENLTKLYTQRGNLEAALAEYRLALTLRPDSALSHNNLGSLLAAKGAIREAAGEYRLALKLDPSLSEARINLGSLLLAQGDLKLAAAELGKALPANPEDARVLNGLGQICFRTGNVRGAIGFCQQAIAAHPDDPEAYLHLGVAYYATSQLGEAAEVFSRAIEVGSRYRDRYLAHYNLGLTYAKLHFWQAAAEEFRQAIRLRPDFRPAADALAKLQPLLPPSGSR